MEQKPTTIHCWITPFIKLGAINHEPWLRVMCQPRLIIIILLFIELLSLLWKLKATYKNSIQPNHVCSRKQTRTAKSVTNLGLTLWFVWWERQKGLGSNSHTKPVCAVSCSQLKWKKATGVIQQCELASCYVVVSHSLWLSMTCEHSCSFGVGFPGHLQMMQGDWDPRVTVHSGAYAPVSSAQCNDPLANAQGSSDSLKDNSWGGGEIEKMKQVTKTLEWGMHWKLFVQKKRGWRQKFNKTYEQHAEQFLFILTTPKFSETDGW